MPFDWSSNNAAHAAAQAAALKRARKAARKSGCGLHTMFLVLAAMCWAVQSGLIQMPWANQDAIRKAQAAERRARARYAAGAGGGGAKKKSGCSLFLVGLFALSLAVRESRRG